MKHDAFNKCILCDAIIDRKTFPEHVIPDYLGGRLKLTLLCNRCNNGVGAKLYSRFKFDFCVRKASYILQDKLPNIYESVENNQKYKTTSPLGVELNAYKNNSGIKIIPVVKNNSIILPTENAINYLEKRLIKEGEKFNRAKSIANMVKETPNNNLASITEKYKIIRWDATKFQLDYSSNNVDLNDSLVLMSYEYLSLLIGKYIYKPYFNNLRSGILNGTKTSNVNVELFTSLKPQPFHLIFPEFEEGKTVINIHLFEYMLAKVEFIGLHIDNKANIDFCYLEDLVEKSSFGALSVVDGKANKWRKFTF